MKLSKSKVKGIIEAKKNNTYTGVILSDKLYWNEMKFTGYTKENAIKEIVKDTQQKAKSIAKQNNNKKSGLLVAWITTKNINKPKDFDSELVTKPVVTYLKGKSVVRTKFDKKDGKLKNGFLDTKYSVRI